MAIVGWNGELKPADQAVIPVWDHGFLYGMTLFETMRTYHGRPFLWDRHMERLSHACREIGIVVEFDNDELLHHIGEVMAANRLSEAYIRLTVSAGEQVFGLPADDYTEPIVIVLAKPLPEIPESLYWHGKPLQLLRTRRNGPETPIRVKSGHYMNNIVAKRELRGYPSGQKGAEGLLLDVELYITEGIVSNICWLQEGVLYTPSVETGILPGITRATVLSLAKQLGITVQEGWYSWSQLLQADEIFLTTSIQELVPVTTLYDTNDQTYVVGSGTIGPVTKTLLDHYRKMAFGTRSS